MVLPTVFLIHTATLEHSTEEVIDDYGSPVPGTPIISTVSCRFVGPKESTGSGGQNIAYIESKPRVLLPAGTAVSEGDTIISTELGFAGSFNINSVKQTYEAAQKIVSHITCEIAAAGATGGV